MKKWWVPSIAAIALAIALGIFGILRVTAAPTVTTIGANISTGGTLTVSGTVYASSTVLITGATTLYSNLNVSGLTTLGNASTTALTVSGNSFIGTVQSGIWNGSTISVPYGGTGLTSYTKNQLLYASDTGTIGQIATSSLGLLTTNVAEGNNLYYTGDRVNSYIHASSTIPKLYTDNTFTGLNIFGNASSTQFTTTGNTYLATTGGYVGIGTTLPGAKLTVAGDGQIIGHLYEDQPFSYAGNKISIISPYITKSNAYKGQLHDHSTNSGGYLSSADLMTAYKAAGYNFVAITDHDLLTSDPGVSDILYIPGVEESPVVGHIISINPTSQSSSSTGQTIIDDIIAESGIPIMAHPNYGAHPWDDAELESITDYFGMEIYNGYLNQYAEDKWDTLLTKYRKSFGTAVDDCHNAGSFNKGWINVFADVNTLAEIVDNIKRGNFYASTGPTLSISVSEKTITITTGDLSTIEFIASGGTVKQTKNNATTDSYTIIGDEVYVRVRITRDSDGKKAWTNPIYVSMSPVSELANGGAIHGNLYVGGIIYPGSGIRDIQTTNYIAGTATGIGIGTTSPTFKLEVNNDTLDDVFKLVTTRNTAGANLATYYHNRGTGNVVDGDKAAIVTFYSDSDTTVSALVTSIKHVAVDVTHTTRTSGLSFWTQNAGGNLTEIMRISGVNVGIGTTSPTFKLEVNSASSDNMLKLVTAKNVAATNAIRINYNKGTANVANNDTIIILGTQSDSNTTANALGTQIKHVAEDIIHATRKSGLAFYTQSAGNLLENVRITGTGLVGIGTSSPQALLTVGSSTPSYLAVGEKYNSAYISGLLEVGGTGTSTIANNLYVVGTLRAGVSHYTGDLIFANNFRITESLPDASPQELIFKNQNGEEILKLDENGNLTIKGSLNNAPTENNNFGIFGDVVRTIKNAFASLGMAIENGVATLKEIVADKITSKNADIENGISTKDQITGEYYCLSIKGGEIVEEKGKCEDLNGQSSTETSSSSQPFSTQTEPPTASSSGSGDTSSTQVDQSATFTPVDSLNSNDFQNSSSTP